MPGREGEKLLTEPGSSGGCQEGCRAVAHPGMHIAGCGPPGRAQRAHETQGNRWHGFHAIKRAQKLPKGSTETTDASNHFTREKVKDYLPGG